MPEKEGIIRIDDRSRPKERSRLKLVSPESADQPLQIAVPKRRRRGSDPVKVEAGCVAAEMERHAAPKETRPRPRHRSLGTRYRITARIGEGATGTVYRAHDILLDMPVALKVLHPSLARDRAAVNTLRQEARITLGLTHRYIVRLHNLEKIAGTYFLIMEYVEGDTLRHVLSQYGRLPSETVGGMVSVCTEALSYAHRHHILHNDLKPENLLLSKRGVMKVIDFGIACLINRQWHGEYIMGTPVYMSPEQLRGEPLDESTDTYALAIMACEFLTGRPPVPEGADASKLELRKALDFGDVSDDIRVVLAKATAFDREERWASVMDFSTAFCNALGVEAPGDPGEEDGEWSGGAVE